jgi:uncharacterized protein involved in exopolysaccharide biosynthesis
VGLFSVFLLALSASVFYATTTPDQYTGTSLVQFRPRATENGGVVSNDTAASATAGYAAYLGTQSTTSAVADPLGLKGADVRDAMAVQLLPATTSLSISFTDGSPELAAQGANALALMAVRRSTDDPVVSAAVLAPAGVPGAPSGPQRVLIVGAGALLGLLLAGTIHYFASVSRRNRPTAQSDVQQVDDSAPVAAADPDPIAVEGVDNTFGPNGSLVGAGVTDSGRPRS